MNRICCCLLICCIALISTGCGSKDMRTDYEKAYDIGVQAYVYGLPLVLTNHTFLEMTTAGDAANGGVPVNQFNHIRSLNDPNSKVVVAPGANALSSIAWLDLTEEPQVLHVPDTADHDFVLALIDPYTENFRNLSTAQQTPVGDFVICGPGQQDNIMPPGTTQINVEYTRIWVIGSTQVKSQEDIPAVNKIQDSYTITPLSKYKITYKTQLQVPSNTTGQKNTIPTGLDFLDTLCQLMQQFPPPKADKEQLDIFATVGLAPGRIPSKDTSLSTETIRGLTDAIAAGPQEIKAAIKTVYEKSAKKHNGYLLGGFGVYGTDYQLRAVIATIGLGAMSSDQAMFALTSTDDMMKPLNGSVQYVMHFTEIPPATEGWSITVYDSKGALIQNPINRYQFNQLSDLYQNTDGSFDIFFQSAKPESGAEIQNWLPVAEGEGFQVIIRLLAPEHVKIHDILEGSGWQPPVIGEKNVKN